MPFSYNGKVIPTKQAFANEFNDYFTNIAYGLMQNMSNTSVNSFKIFRDNINNNSMSLFPTTEEELMDIVNKFRSKKSGNCNELSIELIKKIISLISKPLADIFDKSITTGIFHEEMKIAKDIQNW